LSEKKSGVWSVRKRVEINNVVRMQGGADVGTIMLHANIDPPADLIFSGDGYTDYLFSPQNGAVLGLDPGLSPEYISPVSPPIPCPSVTQDPCELPTAQELSDIASPNQAVSQIAKTAIQAKAQKWYDRNHDLESASVSNYLSILNSKGITGRVIIGGRYLSEKLDGRPETGQTTYYQNTGVDITARLGLKVDPDGEWVFTMGGPGGVVGIEQDEKNISGIFVLLVNKDMDSLIVTGRHEVGHSSDHVEFGPGDHASSGLMLPDADKTQGHFSPDSILRLRGWGR
jgi:hypothetical protein